MNNSSALTAKSLEEHREYLYKIVKLKLFFLHLWLTEQHPEEDFSYVIRERVDIYRKTAANPGLHTPSELFFDAPAWKQMEDRVNALFLRYKDDRVKFEAESFEVFRPSIDERCQKDYLDNSVLARYQCGSLRHELTLASDNATLMFHIANARRPQSIFTEPGYLEDCFRQLLCVAAKLNAQYIGTGTWLNSNRHWLEYFPEEWMQNMGPEQLWPNWGYGFWGQFISARGTFNEKNGAFLRENGKFPFYPRYSFCRVEAMTEKINRRLRENELQA